MENLGMFYGHLVYFTAFGYISGPLGIFCGHLVYFPCFGFFCTKKNLATLPEIRFLKNSHLGETFVPRDEFALKNLALLASPSKPKPKSKVNRLLYILSIVIKSEKLLTVK
jgi:hypothetical protein